MPRDSEHLMQRLPEEVIYQRNQVHGKEAYQKITFDREECIE